MPAIGLMIAAYILIRCLDLMGAAATRYKSKDWEKVMIVVCALAIPWILCMAAALFLIGGNL